MAKKMKRKRAGKTQARRKQTLRDTQEVIDVDEIIANLPKQLPVLAVRDLVAYPAVMVSLHVTRPSSIKAIELSQQGAGVVFVVSQRNGDIEEPEAQDLFKMGVVAHVVRTLKLADGRYRVLLQGISRAESERITVNGRSLQAEVRLVETAEAPALSAAQAAIVDRVRVSLQQLVEYEQLPEEILLVTEEIEDPGMLADVVLAHYKLDVERSQAMLEELRPLPRIEFVDGLLTDDLNQFMLSQQIRDRTQNELTKGQREYYLREQIKQIQKELGEEEGLGGDLGQLKTALEAAKMPKHAQQEADKQFSRLQRMHAEASEYALLRTYLEWMADLPWSKTTKDRYDLKKAQEILDQDHYGLEKVKERIIEFLSVRKLKPDSKGPILCFVGPPGVGKTSLGYSIARALNRKFFRMSLGGVRDEAEIRGHRRTYVGALPGRVIQGLKQAESRNLVMVLDELDKIGADFRGDPASALLEVLDPQQNREFRDHYLNVPFDLSEVIFIATANTTDTIPDALHDRLEVIQIPGYTLHEKVKIAQRFLMPRQLRENGLEKLAVELPDAAAMFLIERYTQEAGVRNLEREIGSLCRKLARQFAEKHKSPKQITVKMVRDLLGVTRFDPEANERKDLVGLARGLAWTSHGGDILPIEVSIARGNGQLNLTGQLGNVMQESARAAVSYARSNAAALGLDEEFHQKYDLHIHVPNGATPKDGPSAGITIATALVSALSKRPVTRDVAMTGEITLRGNVLQIGGLREKALAALRYGIKRVIIPFDNVKDLGEIPKEQREKLTFIPVRHVNEVLALVLMPVPIERKSSSKRTPLRAEA